MPPLVRTAVGVCLLLALLALALKAAGASWVNVAFAVVPLAAAFSLVAAEPRLHWLTRPKPKLTLAVDGAPGGRLVNSGLPPWPLDIERIVANETAEALDTVRGARMLPSWLTTSVLTSRPTAEDHQREKKKFKSQVETYREELNEWLNRYSEAAIARWETFEVSLALSNATGAAHAEAVEVVLELPEGVGRGYADVPVEAPPARPTYRPPQPRSLIPSGIAGWNRPYPIISRPRLDLDSAIFSHGSKQEWNESTDSRRLTAPRVEVQPGRTIAIGAPLWLRAHGDGVHEIQWTVYSQSLDHPVRGSFKLIVPEGDQKRPPFGRVEGILRFPDAPVAREPNGDEATDEIDKSTEPAVRRIRNSDPPLAPPVSDTDGDGDDALATIQAASRYWEWAALGLDAALDRPASSRVDVGDANPGGT